MSQMKKLKRVEEHVGGRKSKMENRRENLRDVKNRPGSLTSTRWAFRKREPGSLGQESRTSRAPGPEEKPGLQPKRGHGGLTRMNSAKFHVSFPP